LLTPCPAARAVDGTTLSGSPGRPNLSRIGRRTGPRGTESVTHRSPHRSPGTVPEPIKDRSSGSLRVTGFEDAPLRPGWCSIGECAIGCDVELELARLMRLEEVHLASGGTKEGDGRWLLCHRSGPRPETAPQPRRCSARSKARPRPVCDCSSSISSSHVPGPPHPGELSRAIANALAAADAAESYGQLGFTCSLCMTSSVSAARRRRRRGLRPLVPSVEGALAPACLLHATALAAGDGSRLEQAAAAFATLGSDLRAAKAATQARPPIAARRSSPARTDAACAAVGRAM
jgi:hypothetical protein